jgi:hypothetical protein
MTQPSLSATIKRIKSNNTKIISPRIDKWLIDHPEGVRVPPEMMPLVEQLLSMPNSDRSGRFGASGRLRCERRQVFDHLGMPGLRAHNPQLQNVFNDGTWRHIRWQIMGLLAGVFTEVEAVHKLPQYSLKVSLDAQNTDEGWGMELKGMSYMQKFLSEGLSDYHNGQVHTMFIATGFERFIFVAEHKMSQDFKELVITPDPKWMRRVKEELNHLADAMEDKKLPEPLAACKAHKGDDYRDCPYSSRCLAQDKFPVKGVWLKDA